jgi:hypothetical protein
MEKDKSFKKKSGRQLMRFWDYLAKQNRFADLNHFKRKGCGHVAGSRYSMPGVVLRF